MVWVQGWLEMASATRPCVLRWSAYAALFSSGSVLYATIAAAMLSRAAMVWVMEALPNAREDGLSKTTGRPGATAPWIAAGLAALVALVGVGFGAIAFSAARFSVSIAHLAASGPTCKRSTFSEKSTSYAPDLL